MHLKARTIKDLYNVKKFVEKPAVDKVPSDLAIIGRYLLMPEIFDILVTQKPGRGGEIQLTDAINALKKYIIELGKKLEKKK